MPLPILYGLEFIIILELLQKLSRYKEVERVMTQDMTRVACDILFFVGSHVVGIEVKSQVIRCLAKEGVIRQKILGYLFVVE